MTQATLTQSATGAREAFLEAIAGMRASDDPGTPAWLVRIRNGAADRFERMRFPTTHDEDWKYTNVSPIVRQSWERAPALHEAHGLALDADGRADRLVFANGRFIPDLSMIDERSDVIVKSLAQAVVENPDVVEAALARYADGSASAFTALNTALIVDGAFVYVPDGEQLNHPIHLCFFSSDSTRPVASHPRILIMLGHAATATVVESYVSFDGAPTLTNVVGEVVLGEGASLDHIRLCEERAHAYHVSTVAVFANRDSSYTSFNLTSGAGIGRNDLQVHLVGEGASCTLNGVSLTQGEQHVDNHTLIDHVESHGTSRQLYKGILDDNSRTVFNGKIVVHPGAQRTDAQQSNKSLLLSADAVLDTKPQLEILADDVRCTHGATVGQLDDEMMFYLRSRGLPQDAARGILTYGFAADIVELVRDPAVRNHCEAVIANRLGDDSVVIPYPWGGTGGPPVDV